MTASGLAAVGVTPAAAFLALGDTELEALGGGVSPKPNAPEPLAIAVEVGTNKTAVGAGAAVEIGTDVAATVGTDVAAVVGTAVADATAVALGVADGVATLVGVAVAPGVAVGVGTGVGVGS